MRPPLEPMLARPVHELPRGDFLYEPKWDGFRALVFRDDRAVDIRSRHDRPLARYFPELVAGILDVDASSLVLDGEIVVTGDQGFDFAAVMLRLHPSATRVARLSRETPASFIAFDVLALGDEDLRTLPFHERRARLDHVLADARPPLLLSPVTSDERVASEWLRVSTGRGADGVVAKPVDVPYRAGVRAMLKVKVEHTADCVVAGVRLTLDGDRVASLLLGLFDEVGSLRHVGVASAFTDRRRAELLRELAPLATSLEGHPWQRGFGLGRSPTGRLGGSAGRWDPATMTIDWVPLRPELVAEVAYDTLDGDRFRHPARLRRWRPDRDPRSCTFAQLRSVPARPILPLVDARA